MRLPDDDELYEVDQTYLGPPRRYIGEMRYRTIFLFLVIAPLTLVLLRKLGMPITLLSVGLWLLGASYLSMKFADYISAESSAGAWLMTFVHELTAPRVEVEGHRGEGAAAAFRAAVRPRGGWAKAMRRTGRTTAARPARPRVLEAKVVRRAPSSLRAAAEMRAIEAAPAAPPEAGPIVETPARTSTQEPARKPASSVWSKSAVRSDDPPTSRPPTSRPAEQPRPQRTDATTGGTTGTGSTTGATGTGWAGRPQPARRDRRESPWQGAAPWQARRDADAETAADDQERTAIRPPATSAYPQSIEEYRRRTAGSSEPQRTTTDDHDTPGGAE